MMIIKFKIFETVSTQPNLGDYVIIRDPFSQGGPSEFFNFTGNNIGKIIKIGKEHGGTGKVFTVKYENIPERLSFSKLNFFNKNNERDCTARDFTYWSEDKDELQVILDAEKYNL